MKAYLQTHTKKLVHGCSQKLYSETLETTQISINRGMDQQIVVHLHSDKQRTDSHNMDEFQKHYTEEKKSDKRL